MYCIKAISCMEKVMPQDTADRFEPVKSLRCAKGERVAFQIVTTYRDLDANYYLRRDGHYTLRSALRPYTSVSQVETVPVRLAAYAERKDDDYISDAPGLFPDPMIPLKANETYAWEVYAPTVLMVVVDVPADFEAGTYPLYFTFTADKKYSLRVDVTVENFAIRKNDLVFTQWFHSDCIADYFKVKMMSEKHWKLIEKFIAMAARTGITMLLTPIFTPALDTAVGGERPTMQLVKIKKTGQKYTFDFTDLRRWVSICKKYGIEHFEISHLFTQWGASFCPKVEVEIDGKLVKEFGWHTASMSDGYKNLLSQLLPALVKELKALGIASNTYFHISDEPSTDKTKPHYTNYVAAKEFLSPYLKGFKIMDALSNIEFYQNGLVSVPVCSTNHSEPFLAVDIPERWCYYCCGQCQEVGNRFIAMPSYRNRILGVQLFMADMHGFLQWGFNFYNTALSLKHIDPFACTDAGMAFPAGDGFSVYPYRNGAVESIRTVVFYQGLQDRMLLKMLADKIGLKEAKAWVNRQAGMEVTFKSYPRNSRFIESLHDALLDALKKD